LGEASRVVAVFDEVMVGWVKPNHIEAAKTIEAVRVDRIKARVKVEPLIVNSSGPCHIACGAASLHGVEQVPRLKVLD
jgi:hypothetical protein